MSFILDALKKAESERNRNIAPVLMDARIAPPRRGLPPWAWLLGGVLLANLVVLGWLLWRQPATVAQGTAADSVSTGEVGSSAAQPLPPSAARPASGPGDDRASTTVLPGAMAPLPPAPASALPPVAASNNAQAAAPLPEADAAILPALHELLATGIALPALRLDLHAYDPAPAHRSVLLNGHRLREGEYTPDGVKVERITPSGVVLEASGRRFRLDVGA